jgi:hypothetical protein
MGGFEKRPAQDGTLFTAVVGATEVAMLFAAIPTKADIHAFAPSNRCRVTSGWVDDPAYSLIAAFITSRAFDPDRAAGAAAEF